VPKARSFFFAPNFCFSFLSARLAHTRPNRRVHLVYMQHITCYTVEYTVSIDYCILYYFIACYLLNFPRLFSYNFQSISSFVKSYYCISHHFDHFFVCQSLNQVNTVSKLTVTVTVKVSTKSFPSILDEDEDLLFFSLRYIIKAIVWQ